ncbi:hypothetical protein FRC12_003819 [Ceratobasidium sp. 428]|nr:hypothetical protein FRC12_003819 [Ceratobasidium sp. 428]
MPEESPRLLGAEYKGQKVLIRRSANYSVTISSVKNSFKSLRSVNADRISLSAFLSELEDTFEVPEELWPATVPQIKRVNVVVDSAAPAQPEPEPEPEPEIEPGREVEPTPATPSAPPKADPKRRKSTAAPKPTPKQQPTPISMDSIPDQPKDWEGVNLRNILMAMYINMERGTSIAGEKILTTPETTISDLEDYITARGKRIIKADARLSFEFEGSNLKGKRTVADLGMGPKGGILNVYIFDS